MSKTLQRFGMQTFGRNILDHSKDFARNIKKKKHQNKTKINNSTKSQLMTSNLYGFPNISQHFLRDQRSVAQNRSPPRGALQGSRRRATAWAASAPRLLRRRRGGAKANMLHGRWIWSAAMRWTWWTLDDFWWFAQVDVRWTVSFELVIFGDFEFGRWFPGFLVLSKFRVNTLKLCPFLWHWLESTQFSLRVVCRRFFISQPGVGLHLMFAKQHGFSSFNLVSIKCSMQKPFFLSKSCKLITRELWLSAFSMKKMDPNSTKRPVPPSAQESCMELPGPWTFAPAKSRGRAENAAEKPWQRLALTNSGLSIVNTVDPTVATFDGHHAHTIGGSSLNRRWSARFFSPTGDCPHHLWCPMLRVTRNMASHLATARHGETEI